MFVSRLCESFVCVFFTSFSVFVVRLSGRPSARVPFPAVKWKERSARSLVRYASIGEFSLGVERGASLKKINKKEKGGMKEKWKRNDVILAFWVNVGSQSSMSEDWNGFDGSLFGKA